MFWSQEVKLFIFFLSYLCPTLSITCLPKGIEVQLQKCQAKPKALCTVALPICTQLSMSFDDLDTFYRFWKKEKKRCFSFIFLKNVLSFDMEHFVCFNTCFSDHRDSNDAFINCFCTQACSEHKESLCTQQLGCLPSCHCTPEGKASHTCWIASPC